MLEPIDFATQAAKSPKVECKPVNGACFVK